MTAAVGVAVPELGRDPDAEVVDSKSLWSGRVRAAEGQRRKRRGRRCALLGQDHRGLQVGGIPRGWFGRGIVQRRHGGLGDAPAGVSRACAGSRAACMYDGSLGASSGRAWSSVGRRAAGCHAEMRSRRVTTFHSLQVAAAQPSDWLESPFDCHHRHCDCSQSPVPSPQSPLHSLCTLLGPRLS